MSNVHSIYSSYTPNHPVFRGGRYLAAFAALDDIDHWELSILQYLASKMPFDKGFVGQVAFPSVATISNSTKIPESTVRKKTGELVKKGYLTKEERTFINERGRFQQMSNDYMLTDRAFQIYEAVVASNQEISNIRKRVVGEPNYDGFGPSRTDSPPATISDRGAYTSEIGPLPVVATNSSFKSPDEGPHTSPNSLPSSAVQRKSVIDDLILTWEELIKRSVNSFERKRFMQEFTRTRSNAVLIDEKLAQIEGDPYLFARAKSMNWLFGGFDMALKNKADIKRIGLRAIKKSWSLEDLADLEKELPELISRNADGFIEVTPAIVDSLFGDALASAKLKLGDKPAKPRTTVKNSQQLVAEIQSNLAKGQTTKVAERLNTILDMVSCSSFATLIDLYSKTEVE